VDAEADPRIGLLAVQVEQLAALVSNQDPIEFQGRRLSIYSCQNATLSLLILSTTYALLHGGKTGAADAVFTLQASNLNSPS
jgi:hypothetical protein